MQIITEEEMKKELDVLAVRGEELYFNKQSDSENISGIIFKQIIDRDDFYELDDIEFMNEPIHINFKKNNILKICRENNMYILHCKNSIISIGSPFC